MAMLMFNPILSSSACPFATGVVEYCTALSEAGLKVSEVAVRHSSAGALTPRIPQRMIPPATTSADAYVEVDAGGGRNVVNRFHAPRTTMLAGKDELSGGLGDGDAFTAALSPEQVKNWVAQDFLAKLPTPEAMSSANGRECAAKLVGRLCELVCELPEGDFFACMADWHQAFYATSHLTSRYDPDFYSSLDKILADLKTQKPESFTQRLLPLHLLIREPFTGLTSVQSMIPKDGRDRDALRTAFRERYTTWFFSQSARPFLADDDELMMRNNFESQFLSPEEKARWLLAEAPSSWAEQADGLLRSWRDSDSSTETRTRRSILEAYLELLARLPADSQPARAQDFYAAFYSAENFHIILNMSDIMWHDFQSGYWREGTYLYECCQRLPKEIFLRELENYVMQEDKNKMRSMLLCLGLRFYPRETAEIFRRSGVSPFRSSHNDKFVYARADSAAGKNGVASSASALALQAWPVAPGLAMKIWATEKDSFTAKTVKELGWSDLGPLLALATSDDEKDFGNRDVIKFINNLSHNLFKTLVVDIGKPSDLLRLLINVVTDDDDVYLEDFLKRLYFFDFNRMDRGLFEAIVRCFGRGTLNEDKFPRLFSQYVAPSGSAPSGGDPRLSGIEWRSRGRHELRHIGERIKAIFAKE